MGISEYENIEIFNKTQSFGINKCENQILRDFIYEYEPDLKNDKDYLLFFDSR